MEEVTTILKFIGLKSSKPGDLRSIGSRYQFVAADEKGSVVFQRDYVILDGASNKITGYAIGNSENEDLALSAFRMHCKKYRFLHKEVVVDGASAHTSKLFQRFKNRSKLLGVVWRPASSSTSLGMVERFHNTFQTRICNSKKFYIGEGIRSRNERSRPSKEVIALYRDKDNLITVRELRKHIRVQRDQILSQEEIILSNP